MLVKDFYDLLKKHKSEFKFYNSFYCGKLSGHIRARNYIGDFCPITFIDHKLTGSNRITLNWPESAKSIGLRRRDAIRIVKLADNVVDAKRNKLCQILGLTGG